MVGSRLQEQPGVLDGLIATTVEKVRMLASLNFSLVLEWLDMAVDEQEVVDPFCLVVPLRINVASSIMANANTVWCCLN